MGSNLSSKKLLKLNHFEKNYIFNTSDLTMSSYFPFLSFFLETPPTPSWDLRAKSLFISQSIVSLAAVPLVLRVRTSSD